MKKKAHQHVNYDSGYCVHKEKNVDFFQGWGKGLLCPHAGVHVFIP